jgi:Ca2+-binding RTX toxin-like protein
MNKRSVGPVGLALLVAVLATVVAASAGAATIGGSARNDTLRGTARADKLYGLAGSDKLYGLGGNDYLNGGAGNDVLVGGPGADILVCGPGVDTVVADAADTIGADCEKVTGLAKPALSVADVAQPEGNGPSTLSFTVRLAQATPLPVTVAYATADGTASAGSDYTAASGQLAFAPGETSKTIAVPVSGDTVVEADETFSLTLSNPVNATLGRATATATIANDDAPSAKPGHFHGTINNGGTVDFDVTPDGSSLTNLSFTFKANCQPNAVLNDEVSLTGVAVIQSDLTFSVIGSGDGLTLLFNGTFSADGSSASGTVNIHESLDYQGTHYECGTGSAGWSASAQG